MVPEKELRKFLDKICVELGFCLPPLQIEKLVSSEAYEADKFVRAILVAEGMDPELELHLLRRLKKSFVDRFGSEIS